MNHDKEAVEMVLAITDGPIVTENITIDQRYRFEQEIANLKAEREHIRGQLRDARALIDSANFIKGGSDYLTNALAIIDDILGEK